MSTPLGSPSRLGDTMLKKQGDAFLCSWSNRADEVEQRHLRNQKVYSEYVIQETAHRLT